MPADVSGLSKNNMTIAPQPLVSVIMPAFNREKYIAESIRSVLAQTYTNLELIIIDDGSTDHTLEIARQFESDGRVRIMQNDKNIGIAMTRNRGLGLAKGELIAPLDSDDVWFDTKKLEKQVAFFNANPDYALVGGAIVHIDPEGNHLRVATFPRSDKELRSIILQFNPFPQSTLLYRRDAIKSCGNYSPDYQVCDDYALWLCVGEHYKFANFNDVFTGYRIHGGNITRTKRLTAAREILDIVKLHAHSYPHHYRGIAKAYLRVLISYIRS